MNFRSDQFPKWPILKWPLSKLTYLRSDRYRSYPFSKWYIFEAPHFWKDSFSKWEVSKWFICRYDLLRISRQQAPGLIFMMSELIFWKLEFFRQFLQVSSSKSRSFRRNFERDVTIFAWRRHFWAANAILAARHDERIKCSNFSNANSKNHPFKTDDEKLNKQIST